MGQLRLPQVRTRLTDIRPPQDSRFKLNPEAGSPYLATVGLIPGADFVTKPLKETKDVYRAVGKADVLREANQLHQIGKNYPGYNSELNKKITTYEKVNAGNRKIRTDNPVDKPADKPYNRPYLRTNTRKQIFERYEALPDGNYYDKASYAVIEKPFDMGHSRGWEHRRLSDAAKELNWSQKQFNDYVNARPDKFRLENRSENRSHKNEMPGKGDIDRIIRDMKNFDKGK